MKIREIPSNGTIPQTHQNNIEDDQNEIENKELQLS